MKKAISIITVLLLFALCGTLTACESSFWRAVKDPFTDSEITYQATTRFLYSQDGGNSWSETIQEVPINQTYYLAIEMQVAQSETTNEEQVVEAVVSIPNTNVLDCYLDDHPGTSITGETDLETGNITYKFNVVAGVSPAKFRVVFECMPIATGRASVSVTYDDKLSETWDMTGTIKYVEEAATVE